MIELCSNSRVSSKNKAEQYKNDAVIFCWPHCLHFYCHWQWAMLQRQCTIFQYIPLRNANLSSSHPLNDFANAAQEASLSISSTYRAKKAALKIHHPRTEPTMGKKGRRDKSKERRQPSTSSPVSVYDVIKVLVLLLPLYFLLAGGFDWVAFFKPTTTVTLLRGSGDVITSSSSSPPHKAIGTNPDDGGVLPSLVEDEGVPKLRGGFIFPNLIEGENLASIKNFEHYINTFEDTPKIPSFEDPIGNSDHDTVVYAQTDSDVSSDSYNRDAKRLKGATPTTSPTPGCNPEEYLRQRDPSAIEIEVSPTTAYTGHAGFSNLFVNAADDMFNIVACRGVSNIASATATPALMYNPTSLDVPINVMSGVCDANNQCNSKTDWRNLQSTNYTVIYAHVHDATNTVRYVGYTSNYTQRQESHLEQRGAGYFRDHTSVRLVSYETIPARENKQMSDRLIQLWRDFLRLDDLPQTLRLMYRMLLRSWHRGGPKKQQSAQLIEIGAQRHYNISPIMAEAFMYDQQKETTLKNYANEAGDTLVEIIDRYWGQNVFIHSLLPYGIQTWKTGQQDDRLSSAIVATVYMLGNNNWRDTFPYAIYPNATTEEQIFTPPNSTEHLGIAISNFWNFLRPYAQNSLRHSFGLVDTQDFAFESLVEPQMILCELGFEHVITLLGGEIIVFRKDNAFVLLHGHPANVCDSRREFPFTRSQRRAVAIDALRIARQRAVGDNAPRRFGAILGSLFREIFVAGHHGSRKFAAALCRDNMYEGDAIDAFGGGLTPADVNHPTSKSARDNPVIQDRTIWTMQRVTDTISQIGVTDAVQLMHLHWQARGVEISDQQIAWRNVLNWFQGNNALRLQIRAAARELPSGGDEPRQRASMDVNDALRTAITEYNNQEGKLLANFRVFFVKKGKTFAASEHAGLKVFNLSTESSKNRKISAMLKDISKHSSVKDLIKGFESVNMKDAKNFIGHKVPPGLTMYKLVLPGPE
jgi:predicted GIY-YIG superfamily endonuclease